MTLTPEQIAEIRKRMDAATPGPWVALQNNGEVAGVTLLLHPMTQHDIASCETPGRQDAGHNATFIAHAPQDIEDLLSTLEARDARIARLVRANGRWRRVCNGYRRIAGFGAK